MMERTFVTQLSQLNDPGCREFSLPAQRPGQATDEEGFLVLAAGRLFAYINRCPHKLLPLNWQSDEFLDSQNCYIVCANHGALFRIEDGVCVQGPCRGARLHGLQVTVENGKIFCAKV